MIPGADAIYLLVASGLGCAVLGWLGRAMVGRDREDQAYADGASSAAAAERAHAQAWDREFSRPGLGDFVTEVLDEAAAGDFYENDEPIEKIHALWDAAEPVLALTAPPHVDERVASPAEMRDHADREVWRTELGALIDGAWDWYDREFQTGQFGALR